MLAADAIVTFLHEAYLEIDPNPVHTLEPFERFEKSSQLIDRYSQLSAEIDDDGILQAVVSLPTGEAVELAIATSELLFGVDREAYNTAAIACDGLSHKQNPDLADNSDDEVA